MSFCIALREGRTWGTNFEPDALLGQEEVEGALVIKGHDEERGCIADENSAFGWRLSCTYSSYAFYIGGGFAENGLRFEICAWNYETYGVPKAV